MKLRKVFVFGTGKRCQKIIEVLEKEGTEILGFIDNSPAKQGTLVYGKKVKSLKDCESVLRKKNIMVIVTPKDNVDILKQLNKIEINYAVYEDIIHPVIVPASSIQKSDDDRVLAGETVLNTKRLLWDSEKFPFTPENWDEYGFKVFSQGNEDGLIQYIINHVEIENKTFIEFGVEDYSECNTKFLLLHNNWSGLCMDGSIASMEKLKRKEFYWKYTIKSKGAFITKDNINQLITENGFSGDIGLLSTDIDGVDYHVLESIDCIRPRILICEFNPIFGGKEKVSIPYKSDFYRTNAHYSNLYFGASLGAFANLAEKKGYKLICISSLGNNAFFIRDDIPNSIPKISVEKAFKEAKFRESRDKEGNLTFLSFSQGRKLIGNLEVIDIESGKSKRICDLQI